jgi:phage baseplate assembly protein W
MPTVTTRSNSPQTSPITTNNNGDLMLSSRNSAITASDLDISFRKHPTKKDVTKKINEAAIIQSLKNLVQLNFYEKPFKPYIGCDVRNLLFEPATPLTASIIQDSILRTIKNFEPRVSVSEVIVSADIDNNMYVVTVTFYIVSSSDPTLLDASFQLLSLSSRT